MLWIIEAKHFYAGLVTDSEGKGMVVRAAPIIGYMIGWNIHRVCAYCRYKRWKHTLMRLIRKPTDTERLKCPMCRDGFNVIENGKDYLHDLPEPFGMFKCEAHHAP